MCCGGTLLARACVFVWCGFEKYCVLNKANSKSHAQYTNTTKARPKQSLVIHKIGFLCTIWKKTW